MSHEHPEFGAPGKEQLNAGDIAAKTAFTEVAENKVVLRADRPGLLLSSTSWTPDEDFDILMQALQGNVP